MHPHPCRCTAPVWIQCLPSKRARMLNLAKGEGIGVFECAERSLLMVFLVAIATPIRVLVVTPFIRPFRWSRLLWTYLIPVIPIVLWFDSIVSVLRVYSVEELSDLTVGFNNYRWNIGRVRSRRLPITVTYLVGVPGIRSDR